MKRKYYKRSTLISAVIWFGFTVAAYFAEFSLGTVATLGGIALMFAWMYEQANITD